jgi:hypothetical protein
MPASVTYEPIATNTVTGSPVSSFTFNSIPGTYTDLIFVFQGYVTAGTTNLDITFNGDTGTNYSSMFYFTSGTSITNNRDINLAAYRSGGIDGTGSVYFVDIMGYSNTSANTRMFTRNYWTGGTYISTGMWRNTATVTSIRLAPTGSTFGVGTTMTLYGIRAA